MPFVERARIELPGGAAPGFGHADVHLAPQRPSVPYVNSHDATGARYAHRDGFSSFEVADALYARCQNEVSAAT